MEAKTEEISSPLSRWWAVLLLGAGLFISYFVVPSENEGLRAAFIVSFVVLGLVILLSDEFLFSPWFWLYLVVVAILHGAALALIPWPRDHEISKGDAIFILADFLVVIAPLELASFNRRRKKKSNAR